MQDKAIAAIAAFVTIALFRNPASNTNVIISITDK